MAGGAAETVGFGDAITGAGATGAINAVIDDKGGGRKRNFWPTRMA